MYTNSNQELVSIPIKPIRSQSNSIKPINIQQSSSVSVQSQQILLNAKKQATQLLKEAQLQKQQALNDMEKQLEGLKEEAYQVAYKEGYVSGFQMGKKDGKKKVISDSTQYIENSLNEWMKTQKEVATYLESINPMIADVIKNGIETIMMQKLEEGHISILPVVKEMIQQVSKRKQIFIRVHPNIFEEVRAAKSQLEEMSEATTFKVFEDIGLTAFGCLIETESEKIDLQLDKQLENLFSEIKQLVI
ncbi:MAG: FliH/SctL family protein [Turicibacter sp.]